MHADGKRPLPLEDALSDLHVAGSVLLHETYAGPWAIDVPAQPVLRQLLGAGTDVRIVPFHFVKRGGFHLRMPGSARISAIEGDVVLCPSGRKHRIGAGRGGAVVSLQRVLAGDRPLSWRVRSADATELFCGVFLLRESPLNPLLGALPVVLKCATRSDGANTMPWLAMQMLMLDQTPSCRASGDYTRARLLEILCAEVIHAYQAALPAGESGWLRALGDARIAAAIAGIHSEPGAAWTVARLADRAALSSSRFAARFRQVVGMTAMRYLLRWRMNVACRLLVEGAPTVEEVALAVGYGSAAPFSRAFRDLVGAPPARWRDAANRSAAGVPASSGFSR